MTQKRTQLNDELNWNIYASQQVHVVNLKKDNIFFNKSNKPETASAEERDK